MIKAKPKVQVITGMAGAEDRLRAFSGSFRQVKDATSSWPALSFMDRCDGSWFVAVVILFLFHFAARGAICNLNVIHFPWTRNIGSGGHKKPLPTFPGFRCDSSGRRSDFHLPFFLTRVKIAGPAYGHSVVPKRLALSKRCIM